MTITAPHMTPIERELYENGHTESYRGFTIKPKRDFGSYGYWSSEHRCNINAGWVITDGFCNVMPGATFAWTIQRAQEMIDDLIEATGDAGEFWRLNYARRHITA